MAEQLCQGGTKGGANGKTGDAQVVLGALQKLISRRGLVAAMNDDPKNALTSDGKKSGDTEAVSPAATSDSGAAARPAKELSPEEQMALYEEKLKEDDWGHQPC